MLGVKLVLVRCKEGRGGEGRGGEGRGGEGREGRGWDGRGGEGREGEGREREREGNKTGLPITYCNKAALTNNRVFQGI